MTVNPEEPNAKYGFRLNEDDDHANIIVAGHDGKIYHADDKNANFGEIVRRAKSGDFGDRFLSLFSLEEQLKDTFDKVGHRISIAYGQVFFDNEPVDNVLSEHILRSHREGTTDYKHLIAFWENIEMNPSKESRDALMEWLRAADFTITIDGLIVGYKGLNKNFTSIRSGPGIVNGVEHDGNLPNDIGNVVEIARSKVDANRTASCSSGLHVGTWDYAKAFAQGAVVAVHVHPRDVVMVPYDSNGQKMRVSRYKVVRQVTDQYGKSVLDDDDWKE